MFKDTLEYLTCEIDVVKRLGARGWIAWRLNRLAKHIYDDTIYQQMIFPNGAEQLAIGSEFGYGIVMLAGHPLEDTTWEWDWEDYTPEEFDKRLDEQIGQ